MRRFVIITVVMFLGLAVLVRAQVPGPALNNLITQDAKAVQAILAKEKLDKKGARKAMAASLLIAHYAQSSKDNPKEMATLRDLALQLLKAIEDDKHADAKALAAKLSPMVKAGAAKTDKVALPKHLEFDLVMRMFSSERVGGFGLEKQIEDLVGAKPAAGDLDKIVALGQKTALIASLVRAYVPEKDEGKKSKKLWLSSSEEMQTNALALAAAASANKVDAIGKAAESLGNSCIKCHDSFR